MAASGLPPRPSRSAQHAGTASVGILSVWGRKFGIPQLVQSRGAFGFLGNLLPAGLNAVTTGIGWFAVNTIAGTFALSTLTHMGFQPSLLIIVVLQVLIAFAGHTFIHQCEKVVFAYLANRVHPHDRDRPST